MNRNIQQVCVQQLAVSSAVWSNTNPTSQRRAAKDASIFTINDCGQKNKKKKKSGHFYSAVSHRQGWRHSALQDTKQMYIKPQKQ